MRQQVETLAGLYPGNPKRVMTRPSTEVILRVITRLTLALLHHAKPPTSLQQRILELLDVPLEIYTRL